MSESKTEIIVGGLVVAGAIAFAVYGAGIAGLGAGSSDQYELSASFQSIEGVNIGTDVRLAGVKIGSVTEIALDTEFYEALATFSINSDTEIPDDSAIAISSEGLLGGNFVEIIPGGSPLFFEAGDQISDTQSSVSLVNLLLRFVSGSGGD